MAAMSRVPANSWRIYLYYPVRWKEALVNKVAMLWRLMRGDPKTTASIERFNQSIPLRDWLRLD
jgi:hypothetical protein